jgi:hypothetical protein
VEQHPVSGIPCPCEGTPHPEGDTVQLRKRLDLARGIRLQALILAANAAGTDTATAAGALAEGYLLAGVCAWTFRDKLGKPVPVNDGTIRELLLDDFERSARIAEEADGLYMQPVLAPLLARVPKSSPTTTMAASTSPTGNGSPVTPRRSRRSSTTTTLTDDTTTTP